MCKTVEYRLVSGFPGYAVGSDGTVWSWRRSGDWRKMSAKANRDGHLHLGLWGYSNKRVNCYVHRLVLTAFIGLQSQGQVCRHLDGNPLNNHLFNLTWGTPKENTADRKRHGRRWLRGEELSHAKLAEADILEARTMARNGMSLRAIAERTGTSKSNIHLIISGKSWRHVPCV